MIDFVKYEIKDYDAQRLEENQFVDFIDEVNASTGEIGAYKVGRFKGLKIVIYYPTETNPYSRVTLAGSLHKYWNDGKHNYNDFGIKEIKEVNTDLIEKFGFYPKNCIIRSIEIGINITPPIITKTVLNGCILHKTTPFEPNTFKKRGNYLQASKQQYIIKIYDKKLHYERNGYDKTDELLRFEIRYLKMHSLKQLGIYTMQDLLNFNLENFKPILLKHWENVLFYDAEALSEIKNKYEYNNPKYWLDLKPNNLKYHRRTLQNLTRKNNGNVKKKVYNLISNKVDLLNTII